MKWAGLSSGCPVVFGLNFQADVLTRRFNKIQDDVWICGEWEFFWVPSSPQEVSTSGEIGILEEITENALD